MELAEAVSRIIGAGRRMDARGWVPATAGNLSIRLPGDRIAVTRSGCHKGFLQDGHVMVVDLDGRPEDPSLRPSAETLLHCGVYRHFPEAGAVLHGHSVPNTVMSRMSGDEILLEGYELLKAFPGLPTHEATVGLPVFDNDQDIARLQSRVSARWREMAEDDTIVPPGYLIRGHGVYVWAADMDGALARLEALEFMLGCELIAQSRGGMFE
ncbi:Methylthioribulose 1-phosphate dehydratase [Roseomonas mucosa]|uniref:Methylthioribulose-1-phosphate dehydratase n=1 Tax=Roseomonas mucosa TaxID=207340 RepID=A0A379N6Z8_9PROT|nr:MULTISPECIES: methylthioribulose 1-phosphate dehydratase [Roseomonas]MBS5901482.1 methylthioribulose 1-phosphate dehydratase [Acetobacteraceae bacterium]AWV23730.1 Methylthioribulose 1-phosphate dehydratase [Roseomonas mucosa]MCG7352416.1 methylthioribulose 1-phosphate dehydratase [Roseomonas mucosa]MCG7357833.1 methylthioribulose 1-phosphate dehydratase [Roseomonas mucosa]MDT8288924.1 methylthioribulose 1-phosphate dehydratase [Roseomonas mucosa]